MTVASLL